MMPIVLDDVTDKVTRPDGSYTYRFNRSKAARSLLDKMDLAVEVFDHREEKPELWYYDNGYWHPGAAQLIAYYLDETAGNESNNDSINDVLRRIRGELRLQPVEFDITNPYLIGCKGGMTLDMRTGKVRKAAPSDLISMPIPVRYDPSARCPKFIQFLEDITNGDDDRLSVIDFLASTLIAQPQEYFVAAPGNGSNGRTVLKNFIRAFLGSDSCRSIPLKDLSNRFTAGFLIRCRVNFCNETEISSIILEFIKRGSEKMPVEQKFKGMVNALLYLKYFFDTNTMPAIPDTSYGAERRLVRQDFPYRFVDNPNPDEPMERQRDPFILEKITTDEELSGVLNLILERAPVVIKQKMIHHRDGGLQEYALQSRSGDVFIELFLEATNNSEGDRVHIDDIRKAYLRYCTVTNSNALSMKALKTLIQEKLSRYIVKDVKIDQTNRSGYMGLKFDQKFFDGIITTLENARKTGMPVFQTLLKAFPDLQNSTNSTLFYQYSTPNSTISNSYGRIVEKYREEKIERNREGIEGNEDKNFPGENLQSENSTFSTFSTVKPLDSDLGGREMVEKGRRMVEEFLQDGGKASLERLIAEFPEAAIFDPPYPIMLAEGGQKITFDELRAWIEVAAAEGGS